MTGRQSGRLGAFVVAIAALVVSIAFRNGTKASRDAIQEAKDHAARSAAAAEVSAKAAAESVAEAKRSNELAELDLAARAEEAERKLQDEANAVRGRIRWSSGNTQPEGKILVKTFLVEVTNHNATRPVFDVRYRHPEIEPDFKMLTQALQPAQREERRWDVPVPYLAEENNSDITPGTEIEFELGGTLWRRSYGLPAYSVPNE